MPLAETEEKTAVIGLSFNTKLADGRDLVMQTHIERDLPEHEINDLVDKVYRVVDRQIALADIDRHQQLIEEAERRIDVAKGTLERLDSASRQRYAERGSRGDWDPDKLPAQERQQRHTVITNLDRDLTDVKLRRQTIDRLKAKVNGTPGATDRQFGAANS